MTLLQTKIAVEEQLEEQEEELLRLRKSVKRKDEDRRRAEEDYQDLKRVRFSLACDSSASAGFTFVEVSGLPYSLGYNTGFSLTRMILNK